MLKNKTSLNKIASFVTGVLILLIALSMPGTAHADGPTTDNGKCISCHEDLYYLHDTGNWFCLEESPMACVDCHGGNPNTLVKDEAHTNRAPHPIINDDVSKCQECHPAQSDERVEMFDQNAGISNVLVAVPYTPDNPHIANNSVPVTGQQQAEDSPAWLNALEIISVLLVFSVVLVLYSIQRYKKYAKNDRDQVEHSK